MNKTQLTIGMIITLALAVSGTYFVSQDDDTYYCKDRNIVMICEKLSAVNDLGIQTRCYFNETYKVCNTGWEKIDIGQEINYSQNQQIKAKQYLCDQTKCIKIT